MLGGPVGWKCSLGEKSPLLAPRLDFVARASPLNCENVYLVFALEKEIAAQAVVGCIGVWQAHAARLRDISARSYAVPKFASIFLLLIIPELPPCRA